MYKVPEERYEILRKYYLENGDLLPSKGVMYCGINLYSYLIELKKKYNKKLIDLECIKRLEMIGMIWNLNEYKWETFYKEVEKYYEENGHINIPIRYKNDAGIRLGRWLQLQRIQYLKCNNSNYGATSNKHFEKLDRLGIIWDPYEEKWIRNYTFAKRYYEENGNLLIPNNYVNEEGIKLGCWIANQRSYYRKQNTSQCNPKFTKERIEMLEQIGMVWDVYNYIKKQTKEKRKTILNEKKRRKNAKLENMWNKCYIEAQKYVARNGNLLVPVDYVVNGIELGRWIGKQRRKYTFSELQQDKVKKLEKLGMIWDYNDYKWNKYYILAKNFYEEKGHLSIPYDYQMDNMNLGSWLNNQRAKYKKNKLDVDKIEKLNLLMIKWFVMDEEWQEKFNIYKKYIALGEEAHISQGKLYDGVNLYNWINTQRINKRNGNLDEDKSMKLNEIGFLWDPLEEKWQKYYGYAKAYYEKYGDLLIPMSYEVDGINLGQWISMQRTNYKKINSKNSNPNFSEERIRLLEEIGMIWTIPANYNKTSFEEQCVFFYVKKCFSDAINNYKGFGIEFDIYIPSLRVAIEYDGEYWHKHKSGKDVEKNNFCVFKKIKLIRIREPKCKRIEGQYEEYRLENNTNITLQNKLKLIFAEQFKINLDIDIIGDMEFIMDRYYRRIDEAWNEKYNYAKMYFEENGNLLIPDKFVIDGIKLGAWMGTQRQAYKGNGKSRITQKHIEMLESIGMVWDVKQAVWQSKYLLAQKYYLQNGNLKISHNYTVDGVQLGRWIETQRQAYKGNHYKITSDQIEKLEEIGMIW